MKTAVLIPFFCLLMALRTTAQLCPGGIQAFSGGPVCGSLTNLGCALAGGPSSGVQLPLSGLTPGALHYSYSDIILVKTGPAPAFSLLANPVRAELPVSAAAAVTVVIYDAGGRPLQSTRLPAGKNTIPVGQWPAGLYFIRSTQGGAMQKFYRLK